MACRVEICPFLEVLDHVKIFDFTQEQVQKRIPEAPSPTMEPPVSVTLLDISNSVTALGGDVFDKTEAIDTEQEEENGETEDVQVSDKGKEKAYSVEDVFG